MEMIPNFGAIFPKISSSSSIADLMKFLQYSFEVRDFNEVESILTARENNMKTKIENLEMGQRECGVLTEEIARLNQERIALIERMRKREDNYAKSFEVLNEKISRLTEDGKKLGEEKKRMGDCYAELYAGYSHKTSETEEAIYKLNEMMNELNNRNLEKLKLEEKLQRSEREYDKSKEEMVRLIEDHRREKKRILERYAKKIDEYLKNKEEKDEMILKIKELENQILESEHIAKMYKLEVKSSDLMVAHMNEEVEELQQEKSEADEVVQKLRCKLLEADQNLEEHRQRFQTLNAKVRLVEHDLENILNVSINDLEKRSATMHIPISGCENNVSARQTNGNEMNSAPPRGQRAIEYHNEPVRKHLENAGCSREMVIIKTEDSDDEKGKEEGSLVSLKLKRKRSANGNENNDTSAIGVHKEKLKRELTSDQPVHGTNVSASIDSDSDSITSSRIEEEVGL